MIYDINPEFPLYIPSKGRYEKRLTSDYLSYMKVNHYIIVEEQEHNDYARHTFKNPYVTLLILDNQFKKNYELLDDLGLSKSTGPGPARNFAWQHSIENGFSHHWVMDDNITNFYRLNNNRKIRVSTGAIFKAMEDFCLRYKNLYMAGPNYEMFVPRKTKQPPLIFNTRIYSCNFIKNDIPFRWRGRYNEDTILSLDILTAGFCTVQFNAFLQNKIRTQALKGGNSDEFYFKEGTLPKSAMLVKEYPQYCKIVHKFNRVHHHCDYGPFKKNKLLKHDVIIKPDDTEYGMNIHRITK